MERVKCVHCKGTRYEVLAVNSNVVLLECLGCGTKYDAGVSVTYACDIKGVVT